MDDIQDIERLLQEVPTIADGAHKQWLKEVLLREGRRQGPGEGRRRRLLASPALKAAAACVLAAILVATGWGAEQVYRSVTKKYFVTSSGPTGPAWEITTPEGKKSYTTSGECVVTISGDPSAAEAGRRHHEEVKSLIAAGRYEFVKSFESPGEPTRHVYKFTLSDGQEWTESFVYPLEKVTSWEDYLQKVHQQQVEHDQAIYDAIAKGDFRLLDIDLIKQHVCRDPSTSEKLSVMEVSLPDGSKVAMVSAYPLGSTPGGYQTPWEDHLREIKEGNRELLDVVIIRRYTYEITLANGSKTLFSYGGQEPLVKGSKAQLFVEGGPTKSP